VVVLGIFKLKIYEGLERRWHTSTNLWTTL